MSYHVRYEDDPDAIDDVWLTYLDDLPGIARQTLHAMGREGYCTVGSIADCSKDDLLDLRGVGDVGFKSLLAALRTVGVPGVPWPTPRQLVFDRAPSDPAWLLNPFDLPQPLPLTVVLGGGDGLFP